MRCVVLSALSVTGVLALIGCLSKQYSMQPFTFSDAKASLQSFPQVNAKGCPVDHRRTLEFCSPLKLYRGGTLTISLPVPHGTDLAIVGPDGKYLFVAFSQPNKASSVQPIFEQTEFKDMARVKLAAKKSQ